MVFDLSRSESFSDAINWINEIRESANASITLVLVGNKSDVDPRVVDSNEAKQFATENGMEYIETSAKTGDNINEAFNVMAKAILNKVENGIIDVSQESSGVKLGTEVGIGFSSSNETKLRTVYEKDDSCSSC